MIKTQNIIDYPYNNSFMQSIIIVSIDQSFNNSYHLITILIQASMIGRLEFEPDIQKKFDHLVTHINEKNQATNGLVKILSGSLNKLAGAICELLKGKDPVKQILISLQQIIASKVLQSQNLANQIKSQIIPQFEQSIDIKQQQKLKQKQNEVKNIRESMQKKVNSLFSNENNFRKAIAEVNSLPKIILSSDKEKALQIYRRIQDQFSDSIDSFNSTLDDYMIKYSEICEMMVNLETKRKNQFRDATIKYLVHQLQNQKSFQHDIFNKSGKLSKMQSKLMIQDKSLDSSQPFYQTTHDKILHLAKISNKNYIDSIVGKKKITSNLLNQQLKISQLKQNYKAGEIAKQLYHELVQTIYPILTFIHKTNHANLLIQIVLFSKDIYIKQFTLKLNLLNSLLTHPLFCDEKFWQDYQSRLMEKIMREESFTKGDRKNLKKNFSNVLDRDILMLVSCEINPYITNVLKNVFARSQLTLAKQPEGVPEINAETSHNEVLKKKKSSLRQPIFS